MMIAEIKMMENNILERMWGNWKPHTLLVGMENGEATLENSVTVL